MDNKNITFHGLSIAVLLAVITVFAASCGRTSGSGFRFEEFSGGSAASSKWETATPESQGIDSEYLVKMMEELDSSNVDIDAVFIVRNGYKVFEAYNKPYSSDIPHRLIDATASFGSTLTGIAIDEGYIEGPEQPVLDLFKSKQDKLKKYISDDLKLKHLLTMSAGLEFRDTWEYELKGLWKMYASSDFTEYALSNKKIHEPGEVFDYSGITSYLLGAALDENTGMKSWEFADNVLFKPLGITDYLWEVSISEDVIMTNYGLWLKAEDFAKFAWMMAQNGEWEGKRIVSENWISEATADQIQFPAKAYWPSDRYGYHWWINDDDTFTAAGSYGQHAFIDPENNLAVIFLSSNSLNAPGNPSAVYEEFIKSAVSDKKLPENPESIAKLETLAEGWERRPESRETIPETLVPYLDRAYTMEKNSLGIKSIKLGLEDDVLDIAIDYETVSYTFKAGNGRYIITDREKTKEATAVSYWPDNRIGIHTLYLGKGTYDNFIMYFSARGLYIDYYDQGGNTGNLRGE